MLENRGKSHMRLRNIPRADSVLNECKEVVKNGSEYRGRWREVFGNSNPVHIEIGMGKGQFLLTLAKQNPKINYIGIERYSSVLLRAVEKLQNDSEIPLSNIRFICMDARSVADVFAFGEINCIYLNFSDPWPKARHAPRRLTSREFLSRYHKLLASDGVIEFKTDNRLLFDFSVAEVNASSEFDLVGSTYDLHHDIEMNQGNIMTEYEEKFSALGNPIYKLIASPKDLH